MGKGGPPCAEERWERPEKGPSGRRGAGDEPDVKDILPVMVGKGWEGLRCEKGEGEDIEGEEGANPGDEET